MNVNVSGPVRVFALVGGLAALAMGVWFFLLGGGVAPSATSEPVKTITPLRARKHATVPAAPKAKPKPKSTREATKTTAPVSPAKPKPKPQAEKPAPRKLVNPEKLPLAVARALMREPVVVVSLYDPEGKVDRMSLGEARAGARRARVGFVALNALDRRASEALTRKLGVLSAPAFLLYKRPGTLAMRIDGFADRDLVAQAAVAALPPSVRGALPARAATPARVTQARWSARANAICRDGDGMSSAPPTTRGQFLARWPGIMAAFKRDVRRIKGLPLPTARAARTRTQRLIGMWDGIHALGLQLLRAANAGDAARLQSLAGRMGGRSDAANRLAGELGASTCTLA